MKALPPNGRKFLANPGHACAWIVLGPGGWRFTRRKPWPVMLLEEGVDPTAYRWPVSGYEVFLVEVGCYDTARLERLAQVLLESGATMCYPLRTEHFGQGLIYYASASDDY